MAVTAISVRDVSKCYHVYNNQAARLANALWPSWRRGAHEIWALRDIGFEVARGESVAVIGRNGSGKSTLLEILAGTLTPTSGEVKVNGRVSALLELGSGFNSEYTGRDNVVLNGLLLGFEREEIVARMDEIAAFAEIGDALDRAVKTYSDGMRMRLAFAVQSLGDPEVLIIDEALSVGDFFFQQKCFARIRELRDRGVTLLLVSHDMATVRDVCSRAIYLKQGRLQFVGETRLATRQYLAEGRDGAPPPALAATQVETAGARELQSIVGDAVWQARPEAAGQPGRILAVAFYDAEGNATTSFRLGSAMRVKVAYRSAKEAATHVTVVIRNKYDQVVTSLGSSRLGLTPPPARQDEQPGIFEMRMDLLLEAGNYSVTATIAHLVAPNRGENLDSTDPIGPITIHWDYEKDVAPFLGMVGFGASGSFKEIQ